jgi:hypothetical protein
MALVDQWSEIEAVLGESWAEARVRLALDDAETARRAFALLGPVNPGRTGEELRLHVVRRGIGVQPNGLRRALQRLDRERIRGKLELVTSSESAPALEVAGAPTLAEGWDALVATLPPDWSDLLVQVELLSSDYVAPASLRMTPVNARRALGERATLDFRVARRNGYGGSPGMTRRGLERCDADGIRGSVRLLRALSSTDPVHTQGPVWHVAGRTV